MKSNFYVHQYERHCAYLYRNILRRTKSSLQCMQLCGVHLCLVKKKQLDVLEDKCGQQIWAGIFLNSKFFMFLKLYNFFLFFCCASFYFPLKAVKAFLFENCLTPLPDQIIISNGPPPRGQCQHIYSLTLKPFQKSYFQLRAYNFGIFRLFINP